MLYPDDMRLFFLFAGLVFLAYYIQCADTANSLYVPLSHRLVSPLSVVAETPAASPDNNNNYAGFGHHVALDGVIMVVGTRYTDSIHIFTRSGLSWTRTQTIYISAASAAAAIAVCNDTVVVGIKSVHNSTGQVLLFSRNNTTSRFITKGTVLSSPADRGGGPLLGDEFGKSVACWSWSELGTTVIVGAPMRSHSNRIHAGQVFAYERKSGDGSWSIQQTIQAKDAGREDFFGSALAIYQDRLVVAAHGKLGDSGAVYSYIRRRINGAGQGHIWEAEFAVSRRDDELSGIFGWSLGLSGQHLVVSMVGPTTGSVFVYGLSGDSRRLRVKELRSRDYVTNDYFGQDVAIHNGRIVVGAPCDQATQGAAYVYALDGVSGDWLLVDKLTARDGEIGDEFGYAVEIGAGIVAIGARGVDNNINVDTGAVYVFRDVTSLTSSDGSAPLYHRNRLLYATSFLVVALMVYCANAKPRRPPIPGWTIGYSKVSFPHFEMELVETSQRSIYKKIDSPTVTLPKYVKALVNTSPRSKYKKRDQ